MTWHRGKNNKAQPHYFLSSGHTSLENMASTTNGTIATQQPDKEKSASVKKRVKKEAQPEASKKREHEDSEEADDEDFNPNEESGDFFNAVTKFSALKPGCYYKIVRLANYRNHRLVAVPVKGFEGTFKNFNNLVQQ
jgi:hypothetical protein